MSDASRSIHPAQRMGVVQLDLQIMNHENDSTSSENGQHLPLLDQETKFSPEVPNLLALTCAIGGLQVTWSVVLSQGAQFLVSIGLPVSWTALVWVASPLCGAIVQPIVGHLSDESQLRWGRRKPFIAVGALSTSISLLMLGWTEEAAQWCTRIWTDDSPQQKTSILTTMFAILWIYLLNISIQPLQVGLRSLIAEQCPTPQQGEASAWASRMTSAGNILGNLAGFLLPRGLYMSHFQSLCIIASLALAVTVSITCLFVREDCPNLNLITTSHKSGVVGTTRRLLKSYETMPIAIRRVCRVQFFSWIGWFPFLFYATSYIGDLYSSFESTSTISSTASRITGTRMGAFAMLLSAIVALTANFLFPSIHNLLASSYFPREVTNVGHAWALSQVHFSMLMFSTLFIQTHVGGIIVVALAGISWAMTLWAPYALVGAEIAAENEKLHGLDMFDDYVKEDSHAGSYMSLHNAAISIPQIIAAFVCYGVFWIGRVTDGRADMTWAFAVGGLASLAAAWASLGLEKK